MEYIFKGATIEQAEELGLEELGLTKEEVTIEVLQEPGTFSKAEIKIIVEDKEEKEETVEDTRLQEIQAKGKEYLEKILELSHSKDMTIESKIKEEEVCFFICGKDARNYIGRRGETLEAIQTLTSIYLNQEAEDHIRIIVDADHYRDHRKKILTQMANSKAHKAFVTQQEIELEPMNSYERSIIHSALQDSDEATTRSDGEGHDRHIVIVPKPFNGPVGSYGTSSNFSKKGPGKVKSYGSKTRRW